MRGRWGFALIGVGVLLVALAVCQPRPRSKDHGPTTTAVEEAPATTAPTTPTTPTTAPSDVVPLAPRPQEQGNPEVEGRGTDGELAQRWPITAVLPKLTPRWRIDYQSEGETLTLLVTLRPIINGQTTPESWRADLATLKAEVLEWLASVRAQGYPTTWIPAEAGAL